MLSVSLNVYTSIIISIYDPYPDVVRESAPMTTPPSYSTAIIVVCC